MDKVKIKLKNNIIVEWRPPINSMGFSWGGCKFINIYENLLIICYANKHEDELTFLNLENFEIENIDVGGYRKNIEMINNEIFVRESYSKSEFDDYKITILQNKTIIEKIAK